LAQAASSLSALSNRLCSRRRRTAYRIIVDEIPQPDAKAEPAIGLKLQMRYSIPLFVYGQGSRP
jgi:P pilus assembly chaperone PapD